MVASFQASIVLKALCLLGHTLRFILLTMVKVIICILWGTTENTITLKRSDTHVLEIIFSNCMKKQMSAFSERSFLPESQDSETSLTIDPFLY